MGYGDGGSTMDMYRNAGPEGTPVDTGHAMGADLYAREGAARAQFSTPAQASGFTRKGDEPNWYNETAAPPVKYSVPNAQKEYMMRKKAIRENAGVEGGLRKEFSALIRSQSRKSST